MFLLLLLRVGGGKHPDYPSRKGFTEGRKVSWPNCIWNWEGEDVPFPLGHKYPVNQEGKIMRVP